MIILRYITGFLIYLAVQFFMLIMWPMNHRWMRKLSEAGAWVMYITPYLRNLCIKNIHAAFPEMTPEQVRETAWKSLKNLALTVCESVWIRQNPEKFASFVDIDPCRFAVEKAIEATKAGQGAIMLTPHLGNWEFASRVLAYTYKLPVGIVVKAARLPFLDKIMGDSRRCGGIARSDRSYGNYRSERGDRDVHKVVADKYCRKRVVEAVAYRAGHCRAARAVVL